MAEKEAVDFGTARKLPQYIAALSVCMGAVAAGAVLGWTSNLTTKLKNGDLNDIIMDADEIGWIGSFANLGAMVMCFPIGFICDLIGRKIAMLLTIIPFTLGWLLIIFANSVDMIYAGRFFAGLAGGAFCVSAPMYTSEIAQKEIRGTLGSYFQLLLTVGILIANVVGAYADPKTLCIVSAIIPLVFGVVFFLQPETPVYSLKKGNVEAARAALRRLRGDAYNVDGEIDQIQEQLADDAKVHISFKESFKKRATQRSLLICFGLMFFQQFSGINAVIFYVGDIFESSGAGLEPEIGTIIVGVMQVLATFVSSLIVDRFGRKILLLLSIVFMAIAGILLGIFFTLKQRHIIDDDSIKDIGFLPILSLCIFIIMFSLGFGPIPWMISSEVFPPEIKSNASSAAGTFNWFLAFLVTKFYFNLTESMGGDSTFYMFACFSLLGTAFVFLICPETKGKTMSEIQDELNGVKGNNRASKTGIDNAAYNS